MRMVLKKRSTNSLEFGIIYGSIALLAIGAARFLPVLTFLPSCAFKGITGLPCPSCGVTRSLVHLSHGDIVSSVTLNPLSALCFLVAVPYLLYSLITLASGIPRVDVDVTDREKNALRVGAVLLVLLNWTYLIFAFQNS